MDAALLIVVEGEVAAGGWLTVDATLGLSFGDTLTS